MARIAGVNIPSNKRIVIGLTSILGIGPATSKLVLAQSDIDESKKAKDLTEDEVKKIRSIIEKDRLVEGDLRREIMGNIKRLKEIGCYRGTRHAKRLPGRGQRSKTNSRTVRGNVRKTAGSGRRALTKT